MDDILQALADQHEELGGMLADLDEAGWDRPTRADGWSVKDVVLHLAQSDELAIASVSGTFDEYTGAFGAGGGIATVDDAAEAGVVAERALPGPDVRERWASSARTMRELFAAADPSERVQWVANRLSVRTLATTRFSEAWIHTGDVADALGITVEPTDRLRLLARLAWRTIPYAFERGGRVLHGPVAFELRGPNGDDWTFAPDEPAVTVIRGDGVELVNVAARRVAASATSLEGEGPDADDVLELVRTYA